MKGRLIALIAMGRLVAVVGVVLVVFSGCKKKYVRDNPSLLHEGSGGADVVRYQRSQPKVKEPEVVAEEVEEKEPEAVTENTEEENPEEQIAGEEE